ncbi:hypothetical protein [Acinetobacter brisouii]|uniref:hypothetical protein n=1 Tax=Acinetobacter brisouii TaxID=396323 RepID=UPI00124C8C13|nr:hypothetical protein [Acinetobacter brisouii]
MPLFLQATLAKIAIIAIMLVTAFVGGWVCGKHHAVNPAPQPAKVSIVKQNEQAAASEVVESQRKSIAVEQSVVETHKRIDTISKEVVKRVEQRQPTTVTVKPKENQHGLNPNNQTLQPSAEQGSVSDAPWTFDIGTIRLLNAARDNDPNYTAAVNNDADQGASEVTVSKFAENDLEIVGQYHELAEQHKALQDYIKEKQEQGYMFCKRPE